jgi:hypothetical protein
MVVAESNLKPNVQNPNHANRVRVVMLTTTRSLADASGEILSELRAEVTVGNAQGPIIEVGIFTRLIFYYLDETEGHL